MKYSLLIILSLLLLLGSCRSDKLEAKKTCRAYMLERIAMRAGETNSLHEIVEDSLYMVLKLNQDFLDLNDAPVISASLNIRPKTVEVTDSCASCAMSGPDYYTINVCKKNGKWLVVGENDQFEFSEIRKKVRKQIADRKIFLREKPQRDSVFVGVLSFYDNVKLYLKNDNELLIQKFKHPPTGNMIKRIYNYAVERNGRNRILEELAKDKYITYDPYLSKDSARFQFYKDTPAINLRKIDDVYVIIGLNDMNAEDITSDYIEENYELLMRTLRITSKRTKDL